MFDFGSGDNYRIIVNGQYVSTSPTVMSSSGVNYLTVDFTSAGGRAARLVTIESSAPAGFYGVYVGPTEGVYKPAGDIVRLQVEGDSFASGAGATITQNGFVYVLGDCLGTQDIWSDGVGGSGYIASAGNTVTTFLQRVPDIIAANPDILVVCGGINDSGFTPQAVQAAVYTYLKTLRAQAALAKTPIFITGAWPGPTGPSAAILATEAAIGAAVASMGDPYMFFIPVATDPNGSWISGVGYSGSPAGAGNSDVYTNGANLPHTNDAGHFFLGSRLADAIMRDLQPY
jgi:lysophospholipase L1-like esterase